MSCLLHSALLRGFAIRALAILFLLPACAAVPQRRSPSAAAESAYQRGMSALKTRNLPAARVAFEDAVKLAPRSAEAHNSLGWVLLTQGDIDKAISEFR